MKISKPHATNEDVENALIHGCFFPVQLAKGADFHGRPWLFLSVFPELDESIRGLNRLHAIATGIYLMPVLAFHAASGLPVIPYLHRPGTQQRLDLAPVSIAKITTILQAVANGLAADVVQPEVAPIGVPARIAGGCAEPPFHPINDPQLNVDENIEPTATAIDADRKSARAEMRSALESAAELGLTENDVTKAVEMLAKNPNAEAKILLPNAEGESVNIVIPKLEMLRGKDSRPREKAHEYCGEVTGYDASHDILILDGKIAITDCKKTWGMPPEIGESVRIDAIRAGKIILDKLIVTTDPHQQGLL